jgi:putative membrane protein
MKTKSLYKNHFLEILYLGGFSAFLLKILISGDAIKYVHPRFIPFLIAGALFAAVIAGAMMISPAAKCHHKVSGIRIVLLVIPVLLGLITPPDTSAMTAYANADQISQSVQAQYPQKQPRLIMQDGKGSDQAQDLNDDQFPEPMNSVRRSREFILDENKFFPIVSDMYESPAAYEGKHITFTGLVYHKKDTPYEEMAVMRLMMTCCSADLQPIGLLCSYPGSAKLAEKSWVKVEGVLSSKKSQQGVLPFVKVEKIEPAEKPAQEYVYPL